MASISLPLFCSLLLVVSSLISSVSAREFQVGGAVGWRIPAINETQLYNVWASRRRFFVGDSLRFSYKDDSVAVVKKWGFYHCDSSNPIAFFNDGNTAIDLENVGTMYFISGDADRCKQGENMMAEVRSPRRVIHIPPSISSPPENSYPVTAPSPSQFLSLGDSPEPSPGYPSSDSVTSFPVSISVIALVVGLALCALKP